MVQSAIRARSATAAKFACRAHIEITQHISYPQYKVNTDQERIISNKAMRKRKAARLSELRNALELGEKTTMTKKYFRGIRR